MEGLAEELQFLSLDISALCFQKNMNLCFILSKTIQTMRDGWKQDLRNLVTNDNPIPIFPPNHLKDTVIIM